MRWAVGLLLAGLYTLTGCGSSDAFTSGAGATVNPITRAPQTVSLMRFRDQWPSAAPRTLDIGNMAYKAGFLADDGVFPKSTTPTVTLTYDSAPAVPHFVGHLTASGLKPNFAYQMKLVGRPGTSSGGGLFGTAAGMTANEVLLRAGRWWNYQTEDAAFTTTNDDAAVASADYAAGWVAGYLYFGVFVTDQYGAFDGDIAANRSYHITWKTGQSGPRDEVLGWFTVTRLTSYGYRRASTAQVELWYEDEPDDPMVVALPDGTYDVALMITEEAFHGVGGSGGGWWESVLVSDWNTGPSPRTGQTWVDGPGMPISFTIGPPPPAGPVVTITSPADGSTFAPGESVVCTAVASSGTGADLSESVSWTVDGEPAGSGASITLTSLALGAHSIVAEVTEGETTVTDSVGITVAEPPQVETMSTAVAALWHFNGKKFQPYVRVDVARDADGAPVAGASVAGTFTGDHTGTVSGTTNSAGVVEFYGPPKHSSANGTFSFTLSQVTAAGLEWTGSVSGDVAYSGERD